MAAVTTTAKNFLIRLSTKGLCFVCLRDIAVIDQGNGDPSETRLQNIARFIGIDQREILKNYFNCELSKCDGVKVKLCKACSRAMGKFNSLYKSLELTRLKLNQCLGKIQNLIGHAERDQDRVEEMKTRVTHVPTAGALTEMRRRVLEKSLKTLEIAPPRVLVKRLNIKLPNADKSSAKDVAQVDLDELGGDDRNSTAGTDEDEGPPDADDETPLNDDDDDTFSEPEANEEGLHSSGTTNETRGDRRRRQKKQHRCPHCKKYEGQYDLFNAHLVHHHLEKFFEPEDKYKETTVSSFQFKQILHHLLFEGLTEETKCTYCPKRLNISDKHKRVLRMTVHLIKQHHGRLTKRLRGLQADPQLPKKLKMIPSGGSCDCGAYFRNSMSLGIHKNQFCPLGSSESSDIISQTALKICFPGSGGTTKSKKPLTCRLCRVKKRPGSDVRRHLARFHCEQFFMQVREPAIPDESFKVLVDHHLFKNVQVKGDKCFSCPYCSKELKRRKLTELFNDMKLHVIKIHYEVLVQELKKLQSDSEITSNAREQEGTSRLSLGISSDGDSVFRCLHCNYRNNIWYAKAHLVNQHCENLFLDHKSPSIPEDKFETICATLLFKDFINGCHCQFCTKSFTDRPNPFRPSYLKLHLVETHYDKLLEKLNELQSDPHLEEKLAEGIASTDQSKQSSSRAEDLWGIGKSLDSLNSQQAESSEVTTPKFPDIVNGTNGESLATEEQVELKFAVPVVELEEDNDGNLEGSDEEVDSNHSFAAPQEEEGEGKERTAKRTRELTDLGSGDAESENGDLDNAPPQKLIKLTIIKQNPSLNN